jgi:hypothetical protein
MDNLFGAMFGALATGVVPVVAYHVSKFIDRFTK